MNKETTSRGPSIDLEKAVANVGNRYDLVIFAALRAREIKSANRHSTRREHIFPTITALAEFEAGVHK